MPQKSPGKRFDSITTLVTALLFFAAATYAQLNVGTIRGVTTDPSGALTANVAITLVSRDTGAERSTVTNAKGEYEIPDIGRGTYKLTAMAPGFTTFVADNIILESGQVRRIDVTLQLGSVTSDVTVNADAAVITTDSAKIQSGFTNKRIAEAPIVGDGRNPQMLLNTLPLVQMTTSTYSVQIAGQPDSQVQTGVDGVPGDGSSLQVSNIGSVANAIELIW